MKKAVLTVFLVLVLDQVSKIWVKTQMIYDESIPVLGHWFYIHFIENPGMAFGLEFGGTIGKLALSLFRVIAVVLIIIYLRKLIHKKASSGLIISISLILAGAIGNIIDSAFYGLIFSESNYFTVAELFPSGGGYAGFLHGNVVDMLYFPLFDGRFPEWLPFWGGDHFLFFRPIFNIADSSITIGVFLILINQKRFFNSL